MRRTWLIVVFGFVTALVVGEIAARVMMPILPAVSTWPTAEMQLKSAQMETLEYDPDVVFLGSSTSQASIDPQLLAEVTGFSDAYNAALPHSTFSSNLVWLEDVVLANTHPRLIVIGVQPWAVPIDDGSLANVMRESAGRDDHWLSEASALLDMRGVLADWDSLSARERLLESGLWTESGHFTGYYERGPIHEDRWVPPSTAGALDSANERALREMVSIATESGARAALLVEPVCCRAGSDGGNERYLAWLRDRAESWDVPILDTFSENWPVELFADPAHLNRAGTEAYTKHLGALLASQLLAAGEEG